MQFLGYRIGDTPFHQSGYQQGEIGERLTVNGVRPIVYIKREDKNQPTGTIKARAVAAALQTYANEKNVILVGLTCGHLGEAGVEMCRRYEKMEKGKKRRFASIVDKHDLDRIGKKLSKYGSFVIEADLDGRRITSSEMIEMVERSLGRTSATIIPIGGIDTSGISYKGLAQELYNNGVRHDWTIYLPLGGGETLLNMGLRFDELGEMPHFVAATTLDNLYSTERSDGESTGLGAEFSHLETAVRDMIARHQIDVVTPSHSEMGEEFDYVSREAKIPTCREVAVAFAAARRHALEGRFVDGQKIVIINSGYDPYTEVSWARKHVKELAAAAALGLLVAGAAPYINDRVSEISYAYEKAATDEDFNMRIASGQREYLVVSVEDPVEAFAWYNAKIEPLEGNGSLLEPRAREFALMPDHGKAGLVRRYLGISSGKIKAYDSWEFAVNGKAYREFQEFLKVREQLMKTSAYARIE